MTGLKSRFDRLIRRSSGGVRAAGLCAALCAILLLHAAGDTPRRQLFDLYQRMPPHLTTGPEVQLVLIDPQSLRDVGPWPWPRYIMARLTQRIAEQGAKAIGFDMIFPEPDRYNPDRIGALYPELSPASQSELARLPTMDSAFAAVLGEHPTVLARIGIADASVDAQPQQPAVAAGPVEAAFAAPLPRAVVAYPAALANIPDLDEVAAGVGLINGPTDGDGIVRRVPLVANVGGIATPGLALELARVGQGLATIRPIVRAGKLRAVGLGRHVMPVTPDGSLELRFATFPPANTTSARLLLQRGFAPGKFRNRIVLIGLAAAGTADVVATPVASQIYGVYVQAQAIDAILNGRSLTRPAWVPWVEWLLGGVIALAAAFLFPSLRGRAALFVPAAIALALILASWLAFRFAGLLLDPVVPLGTGGAAAAAVLVALFVNGGRTQRRLRLALHEERLTVAKASGELDAARDIQIGMLPLREHLRGLDSQIDLDARIEPARTVGGDFYDAIRLSDGRICFVVGDVTGKGVPAALFMALSKALAKSVLLREGADLGAAMSALNGEIARDNRQDMFVTMLIGRIDPANGRVELCNAGHENPLRIAPDGAAVPILMDGGPPLCVVDDFPYAAEVMTLAIDEGLLIVTDGVGEAQSPAGDFFGNDRMQQALAGGPTGGPVGESIDRLIDAVRRFEDGGEPSDDLTILALRRTPARTA